MKERADQPGLAPSVFVALGSNLGNPAANVLRAMQRLEVFSSGSLLRSSLWQSTPVDCPPDSPPFVNAVVGLSPLPNETPETLLAKLQSLEQEFGRRRKRQKNEARPLDLDLLVFGDGIRHSAHLTLPHPRAHLRRFVLQPLSEIAFDLVLPGQNKSVGTLLGELGTDEVVRKIAGL